MSFAAVSCPAGGVIDYLVIKLWINRLANLFIRSLFYYGLNDTTNAFKAYRREVMEGVRPILSPQFNITVELPLKAIVRGYSFSVIPITWRNRDLGRPSSRSGRWGLDICLLSCMSGWRNSFLEAIIRSGDRR